MEFVFAFTNFLQPGILWPEIADMRPIFIISVLAGIVGYFRQSVYPRGQAYRHPIFVYCLLFVLAQILSVHYGGTAVMVEEVGIWYVYVVFVGISILLINTPRALTRYVWGMLAGSMVVVMYGIYAVYAQLPTAVGGRAGAYGMYENHNDYTFIIIMILPFIYMFRRESGSSMQRWILTGSLGLCVLGVLLSLSRGGMLALIFELALIVLLAVERRKRPVLLFVLAIIGSGAISYQWEKRSENQGDLYTYAQSEGSRIELWKAAKNMVMEKPLLGIGTRRFGEFSQDYGEISYDNLGKNSHNTYIEILATSGFLGFIPFMLMLHALWRGLRIPGVTNGPPGLDSIRVASLVSLGATLFRALFDAKAHDWSFYVICSIGIAYIFLQQELRVQAGHAAEGNVGDNTQARRIV